MKNYDYCEAMEQDIKDYIEEHIDPADFAGRDELEQHLNDELWIADSVTGNASGSYTFNTWTAKEYVLDNIDLLQESYKEFGCMDTFADDFFADAWERMDVTIRCYLLGSVISDVLDELEDDLFLESEVIA